MQIINRNCNLPLYLLFLFGPNYFDTRRLEELNQLALPNRKMECSKAWKK